MRGLHDICYYSGSGYNQRQGNAIGVSYNRNFFYPGFKRNEIASRGQDMH